MLHIPWALPIVAFTASLNELYSVKSDDEEHKSRNSYCSDSDVEQAEPTLNLPASYGARCALYNHAIPQALKALRKAVALKQSKIHHFPSNFRSDFTAKTAFSTLWTCVLRILDKLLLKSLSTSYTLPRLQTKYQLPCYALHNLRCLVFLARFIAISQVSARHTKRRQSQASGTRLAPPFTWKCSSHRATSYAALHRTIHGLLLNFLLP